MASLLPVHFCELHYIPSETEQIKLVSFSLNYEKQEIVYVSEKDAREVVNKWKESEEEPEVLQL